MLSEYEDLVGFLNDPKEQVRELAANAVLAYSDDPDFIEFTRSKPKKVIRPLLRLMGDEDCRADIQHTVAQTLVNLSADTKMMELLVSLRATSRAFETMHRLVKKGKDTWEDAETLMMLLANLTITREAREEFLRTDDNGDAAMKLSFFISLYLFFNQFMANPLETQEDHESEDTFKYIGNIICNLTHDKEGRESLTTKKSAEHEQTDVLSRLAEQTRFRHRRLPVISIFKNLATDVELHSLIMQSDIVPRLCNFLYPSNPLDGLDEEAKERGLRRQTEEMHPLIMAHGVGLTKDVAVRKAAMEVFTLLSLTAAGREGFRALGVYEVVRAWHLQETDEEICSAIENFVPLIVMDEEELKEEQRQKQVADEVEQRRARIEMVKRQNEKEAAAEAAAKITPVIEEVVEEQKDPEPAEPAVPDTEVKDLFGDVF